MANATESEELGPRCSCCDGTGRYVVEYGPEFGKSAVCVRCGGTGREYVPGRGLRSAAEHVAAVLRVSADYGLSAPEHRRIAAVLHTALDEPERT